MQLLSEKAGPSRNVQLDPRATAALSDIAPPHRNRIEKWLQYLSDRNLGNIPEERIWKLREGKQLWVLKIPPSFYAYLRFKQGAVVVLDIAPEERLQKMGFSGHGGRSSRSHAASPQQ